MTNTSGVQEEEFFALVSYVPDPLGRFLDRLQQALPGNRPPQAHVTILPPRPLKLPVEAALLKVKQILQQFESFEVELTSVQLFPATSTLYLDISTGSAAIHRMHQALNVEDLHDAERFAYSPHVTLSGPISAEQRGQAQARAEQEWSSNRVSPYFVMQEVVFLWMSGEGVAEDQWERLRTFLLASQRRGKAAGVFIRTS